MSDYRGGGYRGRGGRGGGGYRGGGGNRGGDGYRGRGRGRGGGLQNLDSQNREQREVGYRLLESKSNASERDALMFCGQEDFKRLLSDVGDKRDNRNWVDLMLTTINKAFQTDSTMTNYKMGLKDTLLQERLSFLQNVCDRRLTDDIANLLSGGFGIPIDALVKSLTNFQDIFTHLCSLDPLSAGEMMTVMRKINGLLSAVAVSVTGDWRLQNMAAQYKEATASAEKEASEHKEKEQERRRARATGRQLVTERPTESFRSMPIHPTPADLCNTVKLRENMIKGAFQDPEDYLDIQFRLLREDFVSTLRQGIRDYKKSLTSTDNKRFRSGDVKVYENFTILTPNFGRNGITYHIQMDTKSKVFKKMNWESSKRLMYGSLLCLSLDGFTDSNLFAVIAEREAKNMAKDGIFEIRFLEDSQLEFDSMPNQIGPFLAVESMAYFEAYAHVLAGMKGISADGFPMADYIVSCQRIIGMPRYLSSTQPYRFFSSHVYNHLTSPVALMSHYGAIWPSHTELGFNPAQCDAFRAALTHEFVVIQGPPGTGKTYVGLKIVQAILYNLYGVPCAEDDEEDEEQNRDGAMHKISTLSEDMKDVLKTSCPPKCLNQLLVVCYTNHALDQFLEGMLQFCPKKDIVRVGSRSKNEALSRCNLRNRRVRKSQGLFHAYNDLRAKRETFLKENKLDQLKTQMDFCRTAILPHTVEGLWDDYPDLQNQIFGYADQLGQQRGYHPQHAMTIWLGCDPISFVQSEQRAARNQSDSEEEEEEEKQEVDDSVDIEGEAEREMENRMEENEDDLGFLAQLRKNAKSSITSATDLAEKAIGGAKNFQGVKLTKAQTHKLALKIRDQLASSDMFNEEEVQYYVDKSHDRPDLLSVISMEQRWKLYRFLVWKYQHVLAKKMKTLQTMYTDLVKLGEDLKKQEDIETLSTAKVIGMTTTGAARYQHVLQQVGPEVVIVEEAAEVLEAHIVTALSKKCQHLILIGDHKQLKPNPTVYDLAKRYHLDLSLFERMVNNKLPVKTLNIQHRMRPEVSKFMKHIYEDGLADHQSVKGRDKIEGVEKPVYFFNHNQLENSDEQLMSKSNEFEADMVVGLARYLMRQNYEPTDITIITMYTGQLLLIKRKMPRTEFQGVKITSVDNFQGEENKIIIISLVRSNNENKLGFVKIENRVCVSLSRAKYGMYVFGNFDMLKRGSEMWKKMADEAEKAGELGSKLTLACQRHGNPCDIEKPQDFNTKAPAGGCQELCRARLICGHRCQMTCHVRDQNHTEYKCPSKCSKPLENCGHPCPRLCSQKCMQCVKKVSVRMGCQHVIIIPCYKQYGPVEAIMCTENCDKVLPCGHTCQKKCSEPCTTECKEQVSLTCSVCQENKAVDCFYQQRLTRYPSAYVFRCDTKCDELLVCGHQCTGNCYDCRQGHQKCLVICDKQLPCGHKCNRTCQDCVDNGQCLPCNQPCQFRCSHDTKCNQACSDACVFHVADVGKTCSWGCEHDSCQRDCGQPCSHIPCSKPCGLKVKCRKKTCQDYTCSGVCGEKCPKMCPRCDTARVTKSLSFLAPSVDFDDKTLWVTLVDCNHVLPVEFMDRLIFGTTGPTLFHCPIPKCQKVILNTARYINKCRPIKPLSGTNDTMLTEIRGIGGHTRQASVPFRSSALDNGGGSLSSFSSPAAADVMTSRPVFVSPAGTKRVYSRDELMKMKDFRSSKIVHSIMQHMPDNLRQVPVPAPRVRNPSPSTSSQSAAAAGFTIPSIPLSKINHSLDTAKFNSELKSLSREFKNYKNESYTRSGESMQQDSMTSMLRRFDLGHTSSEELELGSSGAYGGRYSNQPQYLDEQYDYEDDPGFY